MPLAQVGREVDKWGIKRPVIADLRESGAIEGKPIYRNYCSTKEQQAKTQQFVNVAEDADTCWNTVKTALGAKTIKEPCYGIIVDFSLNDNLLEND